MEVLLRRDVDSLGRMGEVVDVADGYARNYLLPRDMAVAVTQSNLQEVERARAARQERERAELTRVEEVAKKLEGFLCLIEERATSEGHLFGSVAAEDVAEALVASGFETIRPANIVMPRHFEELGDHELEVMLHPDVRVPITVRVAALEQIEQPDQQ